MTITRWIKPAARFDGRRASSTTYRWPAAWYVEHEYARCLFGEDLAVSLVSAGQLQRQPSLAVHVTA
jgi:hypothetical protein